MIQNSIHKIRQSGGLLSRLLGPLLKIGLAFMKNVLKPSAKSVLISLWLSAAAWTRYAAIRKKISESGTYTSDLEKQTTLIISNEEIVLWKYSSHLKSLFY